MAVGGSPSRGEAPEVGENGESSVNQFELGAEAGGGAMLGGSKREWNRVMAGCAQGNPRSGEAGGKLWSRNARICKADANRARKQKWPAGWS